MARSGMSHATQSTSLADLLERVLDKGVVIVGDVKIKLVDVELLTIQIRLVICSVERAREMGLDWWMHNDQFSSAAPPQPALVAAQPGVRAMNQESAAEELSSLRRRLQYLEAQLATRPSVG